MRSVPRQKRYFLNYLYIWYSLVFLMLRSACVFLAAGTIHDTSKRPLNDICAVRTDDWCPEVTHSRWNSSSEY